MKRSEIPLNKNLVPCAITTQGLAMQMQGTLRAHDRITCTIQYYTNHKDRYIREKTRTLTNITYFDFLQRVYCGCSKYFVIDFRVVEMSDYPCWCN